MQPHVLAAVVEINTQISFVHWWGNDSTRRLLMGNYGVRYSGEQVDLRYPLRWDEL